MNECTHIGLDVHKDTIAVAVLRPGTAEVDERVIPNTPEAVRRLLRRHDDPDSLRVCYEAGPTGYDTHRFVTSLGVACDVIAPSLIPRRSGARVKTDRIDARNLARLHRAGELTPVRVPTTDGSQGSGSAASCCDTTSAIPEPATSGRSVSRSGLARSPSTSRSHKRRFSSSSPPTS
jgi:hypothetical protein